jgi:hypothetical protein
MFFLGGEAAVHGPAAADWSVGTAGSPPSLMPRERKHLMIRKLKFLGLTLIALFAMSSAGASTASAVEFHSEGSPFTITGAQEGTSNGFDVQFGEVKCTTTIYNGTTPAGVTTETTIKLSPHFTGCTFAGVASTVDTNGCSVTIHFVGSDEGTVTLECPAGQAIVVTGGTKCIVDIQPQDAGIATLTNIGSGATREITADLGNLQVFSYTQTPGTGVGKCEALSKTDGKYTGTATFTGETDHGGTPTHTGLFFA